jgi:hypothetical protein
MNVLTSSKDLQGLPKVLGSLQIRWLRRDISLLCLAMRKCFPEYIHGHIQLCES